MAKRDSYGTFMAREFMPELIKVLYKEDKLLRRRLRGSRHKAYYSEDSSALLSNAFTEKVLQYLIYRELSGLFKIELEAAVYGNTQKRVDFVIYRKPIYRHLNVPEIAVEIKQISLNQDMQLSGQGLKSFADDSIM